MTKEDKIQLVDALKEKFQQYGYFYITDAAGLSVAKTNQLRRMCFEKGITMQVVKNALIKKALETLETDYTPFNNAVLKGYSAIMFAESGSTPAKLIKEFRKANKTEKPILKGASIDTSLYIGDHLLEALTAIKSKEEVIGDIVHLLKSPAMRVVGAVKSGGGRVAGMVKGIAEKG